MLQREVEFLKTANKNLHDQLQSFWNTHVVPLGLKNDNLENWNRELINKLKIAEYQKELDDDAIITLQKEVDRLKAHRLTEFTDEELKNLFAGYDHFFYTPNNFLSDKGVEIKQSVRNKIEYIRKNVLFPKLDG